MGTLTEKITIEKYKKAISEIKEFTNSYYEHQFESSKKFGARHDEHCKAIEDSIKNITGEVKFGHDDEFTSICWFILVLMVVNHSLFLKQRIFVQIH